MSQPEPGQIILVMFPFTDGSAGKVRPALVVSGPRFNYGEDFVICPISSKISPATPFAYTIKENDDCFQQSGLKGESAVKWTKLYTISGVVVVRVLGSLPAAVFEHIKSLIRSIFD